MINGGLVLIAVNLNNIEKPTYPIKTVKVLVKQYPWVAMVLKKKW